MESNLKKKPEWTIADAIIKSLPGVFYLYDENLDLIRWNDALERVSGFSKEELLGKNALTWIRAEDRGELQQAIARCFETGETAELEFPIIMKNGIRYFHVTGAAMVADGKRYLIGVGNDITNTKAMEERLAHVRRMEVLGGFATGVAHDFNNILSSVMGFNSLARLSTKDDDVVLEYLDSITRAVKKGKNLVEQIVLFSSEKDFNKKYVVLSDVVRKALSTSCGHISCAVRISDKLESQSTVLGDPEYFRRVVVNLVANAAQMAKSREDARVDIVSKDIEVKDVELAPVPGMRAGKYVVLEVGNNGEGMDRKTLSRIFDPYFSAVVERGGTGLSLAVTRDIVEKHDGFIACDSDPSEGTVFSVYFPATEKSADTGEDDAAVDEDEMLDLEHPVGGGGGVMFVDDEDTIANFMKAALRRHGYEPFVFTDPFAALKEFEKRLDEVRILVLDVRMPGMSGVELAKRAREIKNDIPIVLCSGNADLKKMELDLDVSAKISKPFSISQMINEVGKAISGTR